MATVKVSLRKLGQERVNALRHGQVELVIVHDGERFRVYQERCPHMGGPLSRGRLCSSQGTLECPWHGYQFDLKSGELQTNPNHTVWVESLCPQDPERFRTPAYKLREFPAEVVGEKLVIEL